MGQSLIKAINAHRVTCIHDSSAAGTRFQQLKFCSVFSSALYDLRIKTRSPIPDPARSYYGVENSEYQEIIGISEEQSEDEGENT